MYASHPAGLTTPSSPGPETDPTDDPLVRSIGGTPLLPLAAVGRSEDPPVELWGKAEFRNPTGSVKDRAALAIVRAALAARRLGPGRTLVDASSGNTGVAYAMLGARLGFDVELYVPRNVNPERLARLRAFGARVTLTDPAEGTDGAQREARSRAEADPGGCFYADQYSNPANPAAHYATTGPEIWRALGGRVTHFVAGVGTGGTISGVGRFLKEQDSSIRVVGVEPTGPIHGLEGLKHLPTAVRPSNYAAEVVDETVRVETEEAERMVGRLALEEGVAVGPSAGAAVVAALSVGRRVPGSLVVCVLPDSGSGLQGDDPR